MHNYAHVTVSMEKMQLGSAVYAYGIMNWVYVRFCVCCVCVRVSECRLYSLFK